MICHILYHDNCFDGACSAAVFMRFYASRIDPGARFRLFGMAHQPHQTFPDHLFQGDENAIVDFKYANHERLTWWFDHHYSAFLTPEDEAHFRSRHSHRKFLDPSFKSCTKLIATIAGSRFGFDPSVLEDLIHWADIVDGALYASAQAAVEVGEPPQKLAAVIEANKDTSFSHRIIRQLSRQPLNQVAHSSGGAGPLPAPASGPHREHPHHPAGFRMQPRRDLFRPDPLRPGGLQQVHPLLSLSRVRTITSA